MDKTTGFTTLRKAVAVNPATCLKVTSFAMIRGISASFNNLGWSKCDTGYYMGGFYEGGCDKLQCIKEIRCCSMSREDYVRWL